MCGSRVVVPPRLQAQVLEELHPGHSGVTRSKELARNYVRRHCLEHDLERKVRECQAYKQQQSFPPKAFLHPLSYPSKPWLHGHLDFAGSIHNATFLVAVVVHSKYQEVSIMASTAAHNTMSKLLEVFSWHDAYETIATDNDPQFITEKLRTFLKLHGVREVLTSPHHPSSNGLAECFMQSLKNRIEKSADVGTSPGYAFSFPDGVSHYIACHQTGDACSVASG